MEKLLRIKYAIWYDFLSGRLGYDEACDLWELLLGPTTQLRREGAK